MFSRSNNALKEANVMLELMLSISDYQPWLKSMLALADDVRMRVHTSICSRWKLRKEEVFQEYQHCAQKALLKKIDTRTLLRLEMCF